MSVKIPAVTGITGSVSAQYWSLFWRGIVIIILCVMIAIGQSSKKNAKVVSDERWQRSVCRVVAAPGFRIQVEVRA